MKFTARFYSTNSSLGNYKNAPSGKTYTSDMSVEGDERVYRFNVAKSGTMKIRLAADYYSSYSDDILATLYRDSDDNDVEISNMNVISGSDYKNNDTYASIGYKTTAELSYKVTKGTYYLRLFKNQSSTGTLSMTSTYRGQQQRWQDQLSFHESQEGRYAPAWRCNGCRWQCDMDQQQDFCCNCFFYW